MWQWPLLIAIFFGIFMFTNKIEGFNTRKYDPSGGQYLWPTRSDYCENKDLETAFSPMICSKGDSINIEYIEGNCRCLNPTTGNCAECYPNIKQ